MFDALLRRIIRVLLDVSQTFLEYFELAVNLNQQASEQRVASNVLTRAQQRSGNFVSVTERVWQQFRIIVR